jgi:hypothetical protein
MPCSQSEVFSWGMTTGICIVFGTTREKAVRPTSEAFCWSSGTGARERSQQEVLGAELTLVALVPMSIRSH